MAVALTFRGERTDTAGRHNDRNFDVTQSTHIDLEKMVDNKYYIYNGNHDKTFYQNELDFYKKHFYKSLNEKNRSNEKARHPERNKTMEEYFKAKMTKPEDMLIQFGDRHTHIGGDKLWEACLEYKERFEKIYGENCKILDMALHMDEATPHVHMRRVWVAKDEKGHEYVSQTMALDELGIERPNMSMPKSRYNNAKVTFSAMERELFRDVCKEMAIELEESKRTKEHLDVSQYRQLQILEQQYILLLQMHQLKLIELDKKRIDEVDKTKNKKIRLRYLSDFCNDYSKEFKKAFTSYRQMSARVVASETVIQRHNLQKEYNKELELENKEIKMQSH